ncbi:MAG: TRAP transporter small permease [Chlorobiales bacterium]|nr:TRAP transporter small permease [Chlorobiales bacterium]
MTDPGRNSFWQAYQRRVGQVIKAAAYLAGLLILAIGFFVFYEVVLRYAFDSPTLWVMDYSIYFAMWAAFLGSAQTMRTRGHVLVDVVTAKLGAKEQRLIRIGVHAVVLSFALTLTAAGVRSTYSAFVMNELTMSALYIPLYYPMSSIPVGSFLLALEEVGSLAGLITNLEPDPEEVVHQ